MMMYDCPGVGSPVVFCDICGCRVSGLFCERHSRPSGIFIALRDKALPMHIIRFVGGSALAFAGSKGRHMTHQDHWYYAGPYVPAGVVYDPGNRMIGDAPSPSYSVWLVPGYERAYGAFGVIDLYNPPPWFEAAQSPQGSAGS